MPVPLNPPYVRPLVPEKQFPHKFYTDFACDIRSLTDGDIFIQFVPMADDQELALDQKSSVRCSLWHAAAEIPEAAAALAAVMAALPLIEEWAKKQEA